MSSDLGHRCPLTNFDQKYTKDTKELKDYSTNTMMFKTWFTPHDGPLDMAEYELTAREKHTEGTPRSSFIQERGKTFFPARSIKKLPPRDPGQRPAPQLQFGYAKGLQVRLPSGKLDKRELIDSRCINGPIQLDLYRRKRRDSLQPLILPSIRVTGMDSERVDSYVKAKKCGDEMVPRNYTAIGTYPNNHSMKNITYRKPSDTQSTPAAIKMSTYSTPVVAPHAGFMVSVASRVKVVPEEHSELENTTTEKFHNAIEGIGYRSLASANDNLNLTGLNGPI